MKARGNSSLEKWDMLFHVSIDVRIPFGTDLERIKRLQAEEHERATELQQKGKWLHLWRVAGKYANISIFNVEGPAELNDILSSLPLFPFMELEVTALCHHPGSLAPDR
jgi:muconolactone D-isomerase